MRLTHAGLIAFAVLSGASAPSQVRYKIFDSGVDFNPTRIGAGGMIAGQDGVRSYAYDRAGGLSTIPPFPNEQQIWAQDVNSSGTVIGGAYRWLGSGTSKLEAFVWDRSQGTRVLDDFGYEAQAHGINELGEVVGNYNVPGSRAFLWKPGQGWITLPPLYEGEPTGADKINNRSEVLGGARKPGFIWAKVIWKADGTIVDMGVPAGQHQNFGFDINDQGFVCGASTGGLGTLGYLWSEAGGYTNIYNPYGQGYIDATGLNNHNVIIGSLIISGQGWKGYIRYPNGTITLLNNLLDSTSQGWDVREAWDINDRGQISAAAYKNGQRRGVLLQPVKDRVPIKVGNGSGLGL